MLEVNTTKTNKVVTISLPGIVGDPIETSTYVAVNAADLGSLNGGKLPADLLARFTANGIILAAGYELDTVVASVEWKTVERDPSGKVVRQYFIVATSITNNVDITNAAAVTIQDFVIHSEQQTFTLQSETLLVEAYGQAIFRFPAYTDAAKTTMGPEWFHAEAAFSIKLNTDAS